MKSKRPLVRQCKHLAKHHVDNPGEPAAACRGSGFATWAQIALLLLRADLDKSLRETEAWFNDSHVIRDELNLDRSPDHTTHSRWEQNVQMRDLRRLLPFSGRIRERHRRRHRNEDTRYHGSDSSASAVGGGYCIFCVQKPVSNAVKL